MKKIVTVIFCALALYYIFIPEIRNNVTKNIIKLVGKYKKLGFEKSIAPDLSNLKEKLTKSPPEWFLEQIKEDFTHITTLPITKEALNETYLWVKGNNEFIIDDFLRIKIIDGKIYLDDYTHAKYLTHRARYMIKALNIISEQVKLPDVDMIIYLWDIVVADLSAQKAPIFTFAKNINVQENRILIPDSLTLEQTASVYNEILKYNEEIPWENKIKKAFWRGVSTGELYDKNDYYNSYTIFLNDKNYNKFPRVKLVEFASNCPDLVDARFSTLTQATPEIASILIKKYPLHTANKKEHLKYNMQINIDGNSCTSPGFAWRLLSNSVTLKDESADIQWFYRIVRPWKHYIPFKNDMSDLLERIEWVRNNDEEVRKISERSTQLIQENLMLSDIYWYLIVLIQEYSKLQNFKAEYNKSMIEISEIVEVK